MSRTCLASTHRQMSLWFAVHGLDQRRASSRSHRVPRGDVDGGVQVGVAGVTAGRAPEVGLALARPPIHMPAHRATLRRERRVDLLDPAGGFVLQAAGEHAPARGEDGPVEPGLLTDVPSRLVDGAAGGSGHVADPEVFDSDEVGGACQFGGRLLDPVLPALSVPGPGPGELSFHFYPPVRPTLGTGQAPLQPQCRSLGRGLERAPVRTRRRDRHAAVHADDRPVAGPLDGGRDRGERNVPPPRPVQRDTVRLRIRDRTGASKLHPPDLRNPHTGPAAVDLLDTLGLSVNNPEPLMYAGATPGRALTDPVEELFPCLIEVTQGLLLDSHRPCRKPRDSRSCRGELTRLLHIPRSRRPPPSPHEPLLQPQIPHEPGIRAMADQPTDLNIGWPQAEPHLTILHTRGF